MHINLRLLVALGLVVAVAAPALAETVQFWSTETTFQSVLDPNGSIEVPSFDTTAYCEAPNYPVLDSVTIEIYHSGSAGIRGDNDDSLQAVDMFASIGRTFSVTGPGLVGFGTNTILEGPIQLTSDDGDGDEFDATAPDGHDFGTLSYADLLAPPAQNPAPGLYETVGPGTIDFDVDVTQMFNTLEFQGLIPDAYQIEVTNPLLTVDLLVTYEYRCVPEPASLSLLALGALAIVRRR